LDSNQLAGSELILNSDGSIYHLQLHPEDIATTIITVGDPDRVATVSKYFDKIELKKQCREFTTHTGIYKGKRLSVVSTGIGTDNIDIVFNELDALVNIDLKTRRIRDEHQQLTLVRIGTSGALQPDIPVDSFLASEIAIGFDNLMHFYQGSEIIDSEFSSALMQHTQWDAAKSDPYVVASDPELLKLFTKDMISSGVTVTNVGFYGPQGRSLRLPLQDDQLNDHIASFRYEGKRITNLEMETSGIYGMAKLLGHRAISLNAILANRATGTFSKKPAETIERLIQYTLNQLIK
jgi:uridine phosphorylase